jgi:CRP-like cAMP-binding protein
MVSPELLRRFAFFSGFSDEELKQLAMAGREQAAPAGEILFVEGKPAHDLYFLTEGTVELLNAGNGNRENIAISSLPAGELLGWSAVVEPYLYTATARAARPSRVIAFANADLEKLMADDHFASLLLKKVAQVIEQRLNDTRIQLLSLLSERTP